MVNKTECGECSHKKVCNMMGDYHIKMAEHESVPELDDVVIEISCANFDKNMVRPR